MDDYFWYMMMFLGGVAAGGINTLAGNGSSITLYFLLDVFQLDPAVANGSNRLGMVTQGFGSLPSFYRNGNVQPRRDWLIFSLLVAGAMAGVTVALWAGGESFRVVYKVLLLVLLPVILIKPERWLRATDVNFRLPKWLLVPVCLCLGFYGGFIQMGMGVFLLLFLVLGARYSLLDGNALKNASTVAYSFICAMIFAYFGLIDWWLGGILALGQWLGGYLGGFFATRYKNAGTWVHRLLVAVILFAIIRAFDLLSYVF